MPILDPRTLAHARPAWRYPADVPGWLTEAEARRLAELAAGLLVLEVGSYHGRSTVALAQTAARVHAVDTHRGDRDCGWGWTLPALQGNLGRYGLAHKVVVHLGESADVLPVLAPGAFGLALIDGAHDFESVRRDVRLAWRLLALEGHLCCHDWHEPEVRRAVREALGEVPGERIDDLWHTVRRG